MGRLVLGDLIAVWLFPALLGSIASLIFWGCVFIGIYPWSLIYGWEFMFDIAVGPGVFVIACSIAAKTPHLREPPGALRAYLARFVRLIVIAELLNIGVYFAFSFVCRILDTDWGVNILFVSRVIDWVILQYLTTRAFLWEALPTADRELVRGQDLGVDEDISWRAWRDE